MATKDEVSLAAEKGDLEGLRAAMKVPGTRPDGKKACNAIVCAAETNQLECVRMLLEMGTPVDSSDDNRRRALHVACSKGSTEVVKELLKHKADPTAQDQDSKRPLDIAVQGGKLPVCKALMKAGAKLQAGQTCKGLAGIVEEVQLEVLVDELKVYANGPADVLEEIQEQDEAIRRALAEQLRLLALKEEAKAGQSIIELERHLEYESDVYFKMKMSEETLAREVVDLRVNLQSTETAYSNMMTQLDSAEFACKEAMEAEAQGDVEYKAMLAELTKTQTERDELERSIVSKEKGKDEYLAMVKQLQEEANAHKLRNRDVAERLKAESAELRGWERDKEAAQELAAEAHAVLRGERSPKKGDMKEPLLPEADGVKAAG